MGYKLSILICTIPSRKESFKRLLNEIQKQVDVNNANNLVELWYDFNETKLIGEKRNELLELAQGDYVSFIDDDDMISPDYIETLLKGIETNPDCISLRGVITWDGLRPEMFEHSIKYNAYKTTENEIKYERYPNHLNCIKASIAKQFKFPSSNFGEDTDWATQIHNSGLLKKEYYTDKILYYYQYKQNK